MEAAKPVNNDDSNHMCLWCYASSPVQHQGLLKDKWLLIKHSLSPHPSYSRPSVPLVRVSLVPAALPPPAEARLPGRGAVGLASSTLRLITPLILGLPVCLQGKNSSLNSPQCPNTHPFSIPVPPFFFFPQTLHPSVPALPEALRDDTKSQLQTGPLARRACLVHHMSWQMGLPWTLPRTTGGSGMRARGGMKRAIEMSWRNQFNSEGIIIKSGLVGA